MWAARESTVHTLEQVLAAVTSARKLFVDVLSVVKNVTLDLVGHHLLVSLLDAMYDQFISCPYQRAWFPNLPCSLDVAKPCRSVEYSSM